MSKYAPLEDYLRGRRTAEVPMTFSDIEQVLGSRLPEKASGHRAWWSNNPSNNVMTKSWLAAGYQTERVDLAGRRLVFRRAAAAAGQAQGGDVRPEEERPGLFDRLRARLAGTVSVGDGVDLTAPAGGVWDSER